jgi:hypothetical protein
VRSFTGGCCDVALHPASKVVTARASIRLALCRPYRLKPEFGLNRWQPLASPARPGQGRVAPVGLGLDAVVTVWLLPTKPRSNAEPEICTRHSISESDSRRRMLDRVRARRPVKKAPAGASVITLAAGGRGTRVPPARATLFSVRDCHPHGRRRSSSPLGDPRGSGQRLKPVPLGHVHTAEKLRPYATDRAYRHWCA